MHVKNHMAMWILWILWILWVEYSGNQLYKPLCAFLVFVDLVWISCGSRVGRWSCHRCSMLDADDCASSCSLWVGGLALDARCSMPTIARPLALCGLLKRFAHRPNS